MEDPVLQILVIVGFTLLNGFLSMSEIAVVSARRTRLKQAADSGSPHAQAALQLAADPTQFMATIQIGITMIGIIVGAYGQATLARLIARHLNQVPVLGPYAGPISLAVVVVGVTYLSLIIGELVPKRIALNDSERIAAVVAIPMQTLSQLASPLVWLLTVSTEGVLKLLGVKPSTAPDITPEEIEVLVEQGTELGVIEESEQDMIESILRLDERRVEAFMTPRSQIMWVDLEDPEEEIRELLMEAKHSRLPVMEGDPDNVLGILYTKDMVVRNLRGEPFDLRATLRPVLFIPESMSTLRVLEIFKQEGKHIALVTDEYGSVQGMVTDMDVLEAIVGEIPSEGEPEEPQATRREDGSWLVDGMLRIDRLWEALDLEDEMGDRYRGYQTVSGFVMTELEGIPTEGEHFDFHELRFEIMDMDGRRVDKVLVRLPSTAAESENGETKEPQTAM